ncbi:hypothetical protein FMN52_15890 [Marinobacter sp. BW6]|uniref:PglL family O-oligosaccharyltransferase n=1 Tax=Marinobacter sp. BW6 TaxID=2592624 RepID=UPI0011DE9DD5|nr:Wzy polymerase domain-containing protein [Marinobacter sp. BW6]TYC58019.1 hypothetical protein FMN52_15890 [Marinobacter sp. BW6]
MRFFPILLAISFGLPLNLYPLSDFPKDFLGIVLFSIFSLAIVWKYSPKIYSSTGVFAILLLCLSFLLTAFQGEGSLAGQYFQAYLIFFFAILLIAVAVPTLIENTDREMVSLILIKGIFYSGVVVSCIALLRYYGILKFFLPWVALDGDRLAGPWGQANLTALILVLSVLAAIYYLQTISGFRKAGVYLLVILFLFCAVLTGSRSWYLFLIVGFLVPAFYYLKAGYSNVSKRPQISSYLKKYVAILLLFALVKAFAPTVDDSIGQKMKELGLLERASAGAMLAARANLASPERFSEWQKSLQNLDYMDSFVFGHGLGRYGNFSFRVEAEKNPVASSNNLWSHPHNILLLALVEWGLVGLLVLVVALMYIAYHFVKSEYSLSNMLMFSIAGIILAQNMVEFSFWYFPFLAIFMFCVSTFLPRIHLGVKDRWLPRLVCGLFFIVFLPTGLRTAMDYYSLVSIFNSSEMNSSDAHSLELIKLSPLIGHAAYKVDIVKSQPSFAAAEREFSEISGLIDVRPEPVFVMRHAVLSSIVLDKDLSCDLLRVTAREFPFTLDTALDDLGYLAEAGADIDLHFFSFCLLQGMAERAD